MYKRRFRRYRQAIPMNYSSATRFTFLPFELEPLGLSPNGQLRPVATALSRVVTRCRADRADRRSSLREPVTFLGRP
jgi:hypothetical protein